MRTGRRPGPSTTAKRSADPRRAGRRQRREQVLKVHRDAQRLLEPLVVVNPYADRLTFADARTRTRRDHLKYLTLIPPIALLHQHQRPSDAPTGDGQAGSLHRGHRRPTSRWPTTWPTRCWAASLDELAPGTRRLLDALDAHVNDRPARGPGARPGPLHPPGAARALGFGDTQLKVHLARLVELDWSCAPRRRRRVLLRAGLGRRGRDGERVLPGLLDPAALDRTASTPAGRRRRLGLRLRHGPVGAAGGPVGAWSAPGRGPVGAWSGRLHEVKARTSSDQTAEQRATAPKALLPAPTNWRRGRRLAAARSPPRGSAVSAAPRPAHARTLSPATPPTGRASPGLVAEFWSGWASAATARARSRTARRLGYLVDWLAERGVTRPAEVTRPMLERYQRHLFHSASPTAHPLSFRSQSHACWRSGRSSMVRQGQPDPATTRPRSWSCPRSSTACPARC